MATSALNILTKLADKFPALLLIKIFENTKNIKEYKICDTADIDLSKLGKQQLCGMEIEIIDPVSGYVDMMRENLLTLKQLKQLFCQKGLLCALTQ